MKCQSQAFFHKIFNAQNRCLDLSERSTELQKLFKNSAKGGKMVSILILCWNNPFLESATTWTWHLSTS